jgi:hypothetical protein
MPELIAPLPLTPAIIGDTIFAYRAFWGQAGELK